MDAIVFLTTLFLLFQTRLFLKTKERKPVWDKWLLRSGAVLGGLFVLDKIGDNNGQFSVQATWVCYVALGMACYFVYVGSRRYPPARLLLLAMLPYLLVLLVQEIVGTFFPKSIFRPYREFIESSIVFSYAWVYTLYGFAASQRKKWAKEHEARIEREERERRERTLLEELVQERTQELTQQKAELSRQKEELERALAELRDTQDQLVQREKLASLGELTAGIAHEIQNPLNFVNNFSEVSVDLLGELQEERQRPAETRDVELEEELLGDLVQNLQKIQHHGQRASGIVRSMLQHSRTSTGQREPTDLNALAEEYLRLSYHGLRAKDKAFNASFEAELDPALPPVAVVGQDVGRVLLNLFNNAFYAVQQRQQIEREKDTLAGLAYRPFVKVMTKQTPIGVQIRVSDNGIGVPDDLQQKIFQPFFTTKPSGSGTGLGLSLSYDIITKGHNGTMDVESIEGKGTTFTMLIPA